MTEQKNNGQGETTPCLSDLEDDRIPQDELMSPGDRRAYILGAMGAALVIGLLFLAVAGIVILLMTLLW